MVDVEQPDDQDKVEKLVEDLDLTSPEFRSETFSFRVYREVRERCPVKAIRLQGNTPEWFVTRYRDILHVFQDDEHFSSFEQIAGGLPGPIPTEEVALKDVDPFIVACHSQKIPMSLDPPQFSTYRRLLNPLFSPAAARSSESSSREIATGLIHDIVGSSEVEFHHSLAKPFPAILICRLLGLPENEWERFAITNPDMSGYASGMNASKEAIMARVIPSVDAQMTMIELAAERRKEPQDDIITAVAHLTVGGRLLNYYELGAIMSILLSGGVHTTTLAIEAALAYLGRNPDVQELLSKEPERIPSFGEEVLRMWPPLHSFNRTVKSPTAIGSQPVATGDSVILSLASANRDPSEFSDPETFVIDRHPNRHMAFVTGIHRCLGSSLARQELRVAIEAVLTGLPRFEIDEANTMIPPMFFAVHDPDRMLTARFTA